jgi:hypothetical protein
MIGGEPLVFHYRWAIPANCAVALAVIVATGIITQIIVNLWRKGEDNPSGR